MSIDAKHYYRFGYLKSEQWQTVRIEALAREKGKCQICGEESIYNDAHHKWYPQKIWETTSEHLAILCRTCHEFLHAIMPQCKTSDKQKGLEHWSKFEGAMIKWRNKKISVCSDTETSRQVTPTQLRTRLAKLEAENELLKSATKPPNAGRSHN